MFTLLGEINSPEVKRGLNFLDKCTFSFDDWSNQPYPKYDNPSPIYYWYFITRAKFDAGGTHWVKWHKMYHSELICKQNVIPKAVLASDGKMHDIGNWQSQSENESYRGSGPAVWKDIMDTCLCTMQLAVHYLHLPTLRSSYVPELTDQD